MTDDTNWNPHDSGDSEEGFPSRGHPPTPGPGCFQLILAAAMVVALLLWQVT